MRITLFLVFLSGFSLFAQDFAPPPAVKSPDSSPKLLVEIIDICGCGLETHYAGGHSALSSFVNDKIVIPNDINWGNIQRVRAYVQFIVEKDGSLTDIHILHTNFSDLDEAILAVFHQMTNWIAGEYDCIVQRERVRVPITVFVE